MIVEHVGVTINFHFILKQHLQNLYFDVRFMEYDFTIISSILLPANVSSYP